MFKPYTNFVNDKMYVEIFKKMRKICGIWFNLSRQILL